MLIFMQVEMEAADESAAAIAAGEGQIETQEQLEEEEVRTNTKQFILQQ